MKCTLHKERFSVGECSVCGKPYCSDCLKEVRGKYYCPDHAPANPDDIKKWVVAFLVLLTIPLLVYVCSLAFSSPSSPPPAPPEETEFVSSFRQEASDHIHTPAPIEEVEPTCEKDGHAGGERCSSCGFITSSPTVIEKLGHTCIDGVCERCGKSVLGGMAVPENETKSPSPAELIASHDFTEALKEWPELKGFAAYDLLNIYAAVETEFSASPSASDDAVLSSVSRKCGVTKEEVSLAYGFVSMNYGIVRDAAGYATTDPASMKPIYGKLSKAEAFGSTLDVTVSIDWIASNSSTVYQNYFNVCDLIQNQGADSYTTINYTATMPTTDGGTATVVFFVVPKTAIDKVKAGNFAEITLSEYVDDLWIHPQLQN